MELWADNTTGVLVEAIAAGATSITVQTLTGAFPTISSSGQIFHVILNGGQPGAAASNTEIVVVTATSAVSGTNYTAFTLENPTLYAHAQNEYCAAVLTAEALNALEADVIGIVSIQGPGTTTEGDALFTVNSSAEERIILDDGTGYLGIPTEGGLVIGVNNPTEPFTGNPPDSLAVAGGNVGFFGLSYLQTGSLTITPAVTGTNGYTYAIELTDRNNNKSSPLLIQSITNGPATLSSTDYITITTPPICPGAIEVAILRLDSAAGFPWSWYVVGTATVSAQGDTITLTDTGGTTSYVPATEDQTMTIGQYGRIALGSESVDGNAMITAPLVLVQTLTGDIYLYLPSAPVVGERHTIVYVGSAGTAYTITIQTYAQSGESSFNYVLGTTPHLGLTVTYDGGTWLAEPIGTLGYLDTNNYNVDSIIMGNGAAANLPLDSYDQITIIGANAQVTTSGGAASGLTAIGYGANGEYQATVVGWNANGTGGNSVVIGSDSRGLGSSDVAIGNGANTNGVASNNVVIGESAAITSNGNLGGSIAIGQSTSVSGSGDLSIAIGYEANASYGYDVAIGEEAVTQHFNQIMLAGYVACNEGIEFPGATYVSATGTNITSNSTVTFLNPPSGSTVTMPTMYEGQLMWLVNTSQYPITVDMASGQTVMAYAGLAAASSLTLPGYTTYCVYLPPVDPVSGATSNTVAIVISNNLPLPTAPGTQFLTTTLSVPATTATEITSATLSPGIYDLQGIVSWEAGTIAAEVAAWFELGTAVGTLITTTDTSTTSTLGAGEACTKPVGSVTITTEGTIVLMGEASAAMTVTNTAIYGPANTATGLIIRQIAPGLG